MIREYRIQCLAKNAMCSKILAFSRSNYVVPSPPFSELAMSFSKLTSNIVYQIAGHVVAEYIDTDRNPSTKLESKL